MRAGIAGGGIMGKLLAFSLIQAGWDVSLFEGAEENTCSMAAAGLLSPVAELEKNDTLIFHLGVAALKQHWPSILAQLPGEIYFRQLGSLLLSHARDVPHLTQWMKIISSKWNQDYEVLTAEKMQALEPEITACQQGYYFSLEGQLDSQHVLMALDRYLREQEKQKKLAWFRKTSVVDMEPKKISTAEKNYSFDWVFDCRGLGAKKRFATLRSVRGELIWLHAPQINITRPIRLMHPRYPLYIAPRPNHVFIVGASEIESEDNSAISVRTMLELLTAVYSLNSQFSEARIINTVTQCRPTLPNHLPQIQYTDGLIAVNGLYRHGFLIAPSLAADILAWVQGNRSSIYSHSIWEACA